MSTVERQQLRPPQSSRIWIPGADAFPQGKILLWSLEYNKLFLSEGPSPGLPQVPNFKLHIKTEKSTTCHSSLPKIHVSGLWDLTIYQYRSWRTHFWAVPFPDWNWTNAASDPKQEKFMYKGHFPPLLRVSPLVLISMPNHRLHISFAGWEREPTMLVQHYKADSILHMPLNFFFFFKRKQRKKKYMIDYKSWITLVGWVWLERTHFTMCTKWNFRLIKSAAKFPLTTQRIECQPDSLP